MEVPTGNTRFATMTETFNIQSLGMRVHKLRYLLPANTRGQWVTTLLNYEQLCFKRTSASLVEFDRPTPAMELLLFCRTA